MDVVKLLAEWFIDAYRTACVCYGRTAALLCDSVQEMRRLYVQASKAAQP